MGNIPRVGFEFCNSSRRIFPFHQTLEFLARKTISNARVALTLDSGGNRVGRFWLLPDLVGLRGGIRQ